MQPVALYRKNLMHNCILIMDIIVYWEHGQVRNLKCQLKWTLHDGHQIRFPLIFLKKNKTPGPKSHFHNQICNISSFLRRLFLTYWANPKKSTSTNAQTRDRVLELNRVVRFDHLQKIRLHQFQKASKFSVWHVLYGTQRLVAAVPTTDRRQHLQRFLRVVRYRRLPSHPWPGTPKLSRRSSLHALRSS